jgi:hypothetical protein
MKPVLGQSKQFFFRVGIPHALFRRFFATHKSFRSKIDFSWNTMCQNMHEQIRALGII